MVDHELIDPKNSDSFRSVAEARQFCCGDVTMTSGDSSARVLGIDAVGAMTEVPLVLMSDRFVSGKVLSSPAGKPLIALSSMSRRSAQSWAVFRCSEKQPGWLFQPLIEKTRVFACGWSINQLTCVL